MPTCSSVALPGVERWQGLPTFMASPVTNETRGISGSCYQHCSRVGPALALWKQRRPRRFCKSQQLHVFVWILVEVWIIFFWVCVPTSARHVLPHVPKGIGMCYLNKDLRVQSFHKLVSYYFFGFAPVQCWTRFSPWINISGITKQCSTSKKCKHGKVKPCKVSLFKRFPICLRWQN